ncbi:MAG: relaxase/mobilization nuclease domain-containing protein [Oscillospiraceae bacterium]
MATTRIIPMHITKGKTLAQSISDRTDYGLNPEKTNDGELTSAYACDPRSFAAEVLISKRQYKFYTGKEEKNDVLVYQVRQSFKPGEVTPEEANQIGYDFASRFLKGKHAFFVCTHTDKAHIHNHIYWNAVTLDCTRKFRDFHRSGRAVARLSDLICTEHQLSVIEKPQRGSSAYNKWHGFKGKLSNREVLRIAIDEALEQKPHDFNAFLSLLSEQGFKIKNGKHLTFLHEDFKQNIRMYTLGDEYSEDAIRAIVKGQKIHQPKKHRTVWDANRPKTIIDIQAKLATGMGEGYRRWATVENLKRMAKTKLYMDEHGFSYEAMSEKKAELFVKEKELSAKITEDQNRLAEINILKTHIVNYSKTRDVYVAYRKSGYSKKYLEEHEPDIIIHKAAKKAFDEMSMKKLPTIKSLQVEFSNLLTSKKTAYAELKKVRDELRDLTVHKANYEELRDLEEREKRKNNEHGRE